MRPWSAERVLASPFVFFGPGSGSLSLFARWYSMTVIGQRGTGRRTFTDGPLTLPGRATNAKGTEDGLPVLFAVDSMYLHGKKTR